LVNFKISQQVGISFGCFGSLTQIGAGIETNNIHFHHITPDKTPAYLMKAQFMQFIPDSSDAIGWLLKMNTINGVFDIDFIFGWRNIYGFMISC
jgi:hypothetical protein